MAIPEKSDLLKIILPFPVVLFFRYFKVKYINIVISKVYVTTRRKSYINGFKEC